ncbi:hypothetical protein ACFLSA_06390 [Bacteroidota bacterium]
MSCDKTDISDEQAKSFIKFYSSISSDLGKDVRTTSDGDYLVLGTITTATNGMDIILFKTDKFGNKLWARTYGYEEDEDAANLQLLNSGELLIFGTSSSDSTNKDFFLIITDSEGNEKWSRTYGDISYEEGYYAIQTNGGDFAMVGSTTGDIAGTNLSDIDANRDALVYLVNNQGDSIINDNLFSVSTYSEIGKQIFEIENGVFFVIGDKSPAGLREIAYYVLDTSLKVGYPFPLPEVVTSSVSFSYARILPNQELIILGNQITNQLSDIYLMSFNVSYDTELQLTLNFQKTIQSNGDNQGNRFCITNNNEYAIIGTTNGPGSNGGYDAYLLTVDKDGNELYSQTYGYVDNESGNAICVTPDNGFIFTGSAELSDNSMISLIKTLPGGELLE